MRRFAEMTSVLLAVVCCGGQDINPTSVSPALDAPSIPLSQDQRFTLDTILVLGLPGEGASKTSGSRDDSDALHQAQELAMVARRGIGDAIRCQEEQTPGPAGWVIVSLEVVESGRVIGGATMPAGGQEGLAALADCLLAHARQWRFPERTVPGSTILRVPYQFFSETSVGEP